MNKFVPDDKLIGCFRIDDDGIREVITVFDNGNTLSRMMMPKEVFIEAYNKWIKKEGETIEQTSSKEEKKEASSESQ